MRIDPATGETPPAALRGKSQRPPARCPECGSDLPPVRASRQLFCRPACTQANENRWTVRGKRLALLVAAARQTRDGTRGTPVQRSNGATAARMLRQLLQDWREEDAAAGRTDAITLFTIKNRFGHLDH